MATLDDFRLRHGLSEGVVEISFPSGSPVFIFKVRQLAAEEVNGILARSVLKAEKSKGNVDLIVMIQQEQYKAIIRNIESYEDLSKKESKVPTDEDRAALLDFSYFHQVDILNGYEAAVAPADKPVKKNSAKGKKRK